MMEDPPRTAIEDAEPHRRVGTAGVDSDCESTNPWSKLLAEDLAVGYPDSVGPVLECETIVLPEGKITAFVGPNGSGKSTLLKALADQLQPERGRILLEGDRLRDYDSKALARELGLLSQERESPQSITVEELVYHGRYPHRGPFEARSSEDHAAVDRAIDLAGIDYLRESDLGSLSGGQRQLAWLAMVLAQDTDVLLLDEPTTFLDIHHQLRVLEVIRTLNEDAGVTVGLVLHDVEQAARIADTLVALENGTVYEWGPPEAVLSERLLADVFGVEARVEHREGDAPGVVPLRSLAEDAH